MDTKVLALCLRSFCESNLLERKFDRKLKSLTLWDAEMADQSLTQVSRQRAQASVRRDDFGNINVNFRHPCVNIFNSIKNPAKSCS
jgi:hypothetical protein